MHLWGFGAKILVRGTVVPDLAKIKKIPFDSLTLAAVTCELQPLVGGKLQRIVQPTERNLTLGIYGVGKESYVLLSCSPVFARMHLAASIPASTGEQPPLGAALRRFADGARIAAIRQIGFDRQVEILLTKSEGTSRLIAELTGKHANLVFVGPDGKVLAAAHYVSSRQSARTILPGQAYEPPPFPHRKPIFMATTLEEIEDSEGASPFLRELLSVQQDPLAKLRQIREAVQNCRFEPIATLEHGAYPISAADLGFEEHRVESISLSLESHFGRLEQTAEREAVRSRLLGPLKRVLLAREVALSELRQAADTAKRAGELQLKGELLLAYAHSIEPEATRFETQDYEGSPLTIELNPELSPLENAQRLFEKAKRAKSGAAHVQEQTARIESEVLDLLAHIRRAEDAADIDELRDLEERAKGRRWLHETRAPAKSAEEKPYEGHRIRERLGPGGVRVLFGENATSNDYLTLRVARPNDIWLHVRGSTSAHVVILTGNRPDRIGSEALLFAARIAVQSSASKHSSYVPVDYTLKKYVRKPRGGKAGTATYSHEKTLHVEHVDKISKK